MSKINTLIKILKMSQNEVKRYGKKRLKNFGYEPVLADGYMYAKGELPILLVAHMDTVFNSTSFIKVNECHILSSKRGLGADDRAGIFSIFEILSNGYRPHVLFLEDEEIGCVGAKKFTKSKIIPDVKYIIELDRRGKNDAVFYDCDNQDFINYVLPFGFELSYGSCSDISTIAPHLGVSAVNLSIGYYNEHTLVETLNTKHMFDTIYKVMDMLDSIPEDVFEYIECDTKGYNNYVYYNGKFYWYDEDYDLDEQKYYKYYDSKDNSYADDGLIPVTDCYLNTIDGELLDLYDCENYYIDRNNNIYTLEKVLVENAVALGFDYTTLNYEDFRVRELQNELYETKYYYGK